MLGETGLLTSTEVSAFARRGWFVWLRTFSALGGLGTLRSLGASGDGRLLWILGDFLAVMIDFGFFWFFWFGTLRALVTFRCLDEVTAFRFLRDGLAFMTRGERLVWFGFLGRFRMLGSFGAFGSFVWLILSGVSSFMGMGRRATAIRFVWFGWLRAFGPLRTSVMEVRADGNWDFG